MSTMMTMLTKMMTTTTTMMLDTWIHGSKMFGTVPLTMLALRIRKTFGCWAHALCDLGL
jgi:hypothetical protein